MTKVNDFETDLLEHIFENVAIANVGDAGGLPISVSAGSLYIALFTASPTDTGSFANEATYTGYARAAIGRTVGNWTTASGATTNTNAITFAACTALSDTVTHFAICKDLSTSTSDFMVYWGALTASLAISAGITPEFAATDLDVSED